MEKKIRVKHLTPCATCGGRGGEGEVSCAHCHGRGQVRRVQQSIFGQFVNVSVCPKCRGEGRTLRESCKSCGGEGRVSDTETLSVKVPRGVANGNFIPLRGMGDAGFRGGPAGDLIVWLEERPHPLFDRDSDDLRLALPVSFATLALGGRMGDAQALADMATPGLIAALTCLIISVRQRERIWIGAPTFMLVFPKTSHVELVFGDTPVYADFLLFGMVGNLTFKGWNRLPAKQRAIAAWRERLARWRV